MVLKSVGIRQSHKERDEENKQEITGMTAQVGMTQRDHPETSYNKGSHASCTNV